ncbi:MAG: polyprenyl synthetase family protein [Candidatus Caenarcaniphilales bacterium]|nr:polyprenyl synthetase family protein [Candidatus Caenarcaniphilales bacterium]
MASSFTNSFMEKGDDSHITNSLFASVQNDLAKVDQILQNDIPNQSGALKQITQYILNGGGKRIRPAISILCAYLTNNLKTEIDEKQYTLAILTELIHTASLVHDDLLDEADSRRGQESVHLKWNSKVSVIVGDFLFAQASVKLGELENTEIVKTYANVLANLCTGEISQAQNKFNLEALSWENYFTKSFSKTASLFAAAAKCSAILNDQDAETINKLHDFGKNLGLAFQIIDDLLDYTADEKNLGKPLMGDLSQGIFTAPFLYAFEDDVNRNTLRTIISRRFSDTNDLNKVKDIIMLANGFEKTQKLAESFIERAQKNIEETPQSKFKEDLLKLSAYILTRDL